MPTAVTSSSTSRRVSTVLAVPAMPDAHLLPVRAHVLASPTAAAAHLVAEHRVAGDPPAEPPLVDAVAHRGHPAAPLVAGAQRVGGVPRLEVVELAGEELHVGA